MATTQSAIALPELPYARNALEPYMSRETLDYHYGKHHKAYVEKVNSLIAGTEFEDASLEELVSAATGTLFNNAAQVWNHNFVWNCLSPQRQKPGKELTRALASLPAVSSRCRSNSTGRPPPISSAPAGPGSSRMRWAAL